MGANMEIKNDFGRTPLICACDNTHELCAIVLARAGACINTQDNEGKSAMHYAILRGFSTELSKASEQFKESPEGRKRSSQIINEWRIGGIALVAAVICAMVYQKSTK